MYDEEKNKENIDKHGISFGNAGNYSEHYKNLYPPYTREAPTYFTRKGIKCLYTSGTTGYSPNPSRVVSFTNIHEKYKDLGNPHVGDKTGTSFNSLITCVLRVPDSDLYIAMADRWQPGPKHAWGHKLTETYYKHMFRNYKPDTTIYHYICGFDQLIYSIP